MYEEERVDLREVRRLLKRIDKVVAQVDGSRGSDFEGKNTSQRNAQITRRLLLCAHMLEKASIMVLDEYHWFKGEDVHMLYDDDPDVPQTKRSRANRTSGAQLDP